MVRPLYTAPTRRRATATAITADAVDWPAMAAVLVLFLSKNMYNKSQSSKVGAARRASAQQKESHPGHMVTLAATILLVELPAGHGALASLVFVQRGGAPGARGSRS